MILPVLRVVGQNGAGQDRAAVFPARGYWVAALADGAGGMPGGAEAAEMVIRLVCDALPGMHHPDVPETWCDLLLEIDAAVERDGGAGETTAVVAAVSSEWIVGASVGDSQMWLIQSGEFHDLTRHQRQRPFLGQGGAWPQPFEAIMPSGTLLLGSDGLLKYADASAICAAADASTQEEVAERLLRLVRLPNGELWDDISLILCRPASLASAPGRAM